MMKAITRLCFFRQTQPVHLLIWEIMTYLAIREEGTTSALSSLLRALQEARPKANQILTADISLPQDFNVGLNTLKQNLC